MIRAVIIDDEEKGRKLLRNLLEQYCSDVAVLEMADSAETGAEAIHRLQPDLVFLDIVMPNEDGFGLLTRIAGFDLEIIFATAYDQYAIRAIRACALDYLLKPIDFEELQAAVQRAREKIEAKRNGEVVDNRLETLIESARTGQNLPHKIGFPTAQGVRFYEIEEIHVCRAEGNYTTVFFGGRERLELISKTLKEFEEILSGHNFVRTHRSYLVNLNHIKEYRRFNSPDSTDGEGGCIISANNMKVPVSRDKRKHLLERISKPF